MSSISSVLHQLEQERSRINSQLASVSRALAALRTSGRSSGSRTMSAAGRARVAAAQRARWAKAKGKVISVKSSRTRTMSAAAITRIRAAQKARWAKWRKQNKKG